METIGENLPAWAAADDSDALVEIRRAFHTLKGSGRMVRALVIGELAWSIENLLNRVLDGSIQTDEAVRHVVADVVALMPELVEEFAGKAQRQRDDVDRLAAAAHALARGEAPVAIMPAQPTTSSASLLNCRAPTSLIRNCWKYSATRRRHIWPPWSVFSPIVRSPFLSR